MSVNMDELTLVIMVCALSFNLTPVYTFRYFLTEW